MARTRGFLLLAHFQESYGRLVLRTHFSDVAEDAEHVILEHAPIGR